MTTTAITWIETTEERYYEMLGVLPPASQGSMIGAHGFQVGEPMDHNERGEPSCRYCLDLRYEQEGSAA